MANLSRSGVVSDSEYRGYTFALSPCAAKDWPLSRPKGFLRWVLVLKPGDDGSTFGGNPLACAVGREALHVLVDEKLPERAFEMGRYFREGLEAMHVPCVKEVRGRGLMIGVEIKSEFGKAHDFALKLLHEGVITKDTHEAVLRFAPPLVITKAEIDLVLEKVEKVFTEAL